MNIITKAWQRYCNWLDEMGLTPENKRCCVPLDERAQKALRAEQISSTPTKNRKQIKLQAANNNEKVGFTTAYLFSLLIID